MFPRLYANYWLANDDQKGKIESDDKADVRGDDYTIESLPLPQLLSLLTETKAPFFYGDDESLELIVKPNHSLPLRNQNLHLVKQKSSNNKSNNAPMNGTNYRFMEKLYENFMWSKFVKDSNGNDLSDEEDKLNDALLELFRWSIQPPHPAIYEDLKNQSGINIFCQGIFWL